MVMYSYTIATYSIHEYMYNIYLYSVIFLTPINPTSRLSLDSFFKVSHPFIGVSSLHWMQVSHLTQRTEESDGQPTPRPWDGTINNQPHIHLI